MAGHSYKEKKAKVCKLPTREELAFLKKMARSRKSLFEKMIAAMTYRNEKRHYPRFKKHLDLTFRKMDSMMRHDKGVTQDLSLGGFRMDLCCLGKPPAVDEIIEVTLKNTEHKRSCLVRAIGRIMWVRAKEDEEAYEVGVKLTYVNTEDRKKFLACLADEF